jgi:LPXTG-motif cell wall-anchored protein
MSTVRKRVAAAHLRDLGARRRIAVAGLTALAGATFAAPVAFTSRAGASPVEVETTTTLQQEPETTVTASTTTTLAPTTIVSIPLPLDTPTTTLPVVTTTTDSAVVSEGFVQLGVGQAPLSLAITPQAAAAQLPRTGAAPTLPTLTGIALLIAGVLASTAKRRRYFGAAKVKSKRS